MKEVEPIIVQSVEVVSTKGGTALFLLTKEKTIVIQVDTTIGEALLAAQNGKQPERPQTHDCMVNLLVGLEAKVSHIVIVDAQDGVFFARIVVKQESVVAKKIAEIDARPSDALVLALKTKCPIFLNRKVLDACEDMSDTLARLRKKS